MTKDELQAKRAVALSELKNIEVALCLDEHYIDIIAKENAELKKEVLEVRQHLELTEREWGKDTTKLIHFKTQLTKATEIIRTFLNMPMPNNEEVFTDVGVFLTKAEQFLKEIEKENEMDNDERDC